jgi:integrase
MTTSDRTTRRPFGHLYRHRRSRFWWIRYRVNGKTYRESSGSTSLRTAEQLLARKQAELGLGHFTAPDVRRTTFEDLAQAIRDDYAVNGRRSTERLEDSLKRLRVVFGAARAVTITADRLTAYLRTRLDQGAAPATVRNELNALRRAFRLAKRAGRVAGVPEFPSVAVHNARTGFFQEADFRAVQAALAEPLRPVVEFAYLTGWRIPSEVLTLTWAHVDLGAGTVRLEVGTTKNREGRVFPSGVLPALHALLERQRAHTTAVERRLGQIIPWVFHRDGRPIRDFYHAWKSACQRAATVREGALERVVRPELLGRIPHDLRRTAVRNLERAGVSRSVAMKLTGHRTESVYRRYAIVAEADLREGVAKLAVLHGGSRGSDASRVS